MNRLRKIVVAGLSGMAIVAVILVILSTILEPGITRLLLTKINSSLENPVEVKHIEFSLLRNFPRASVTLKEIVILPAEREAQIQDYQADTLLTAGSLRLSLRIPALLKKRYIVDRLAVENGIINIRRFNDGRLNLHLHQREGRRDSSSIMADLRYITIKKTRINYTGDASAITASVNITESSGRLKISDGSTEADAMVTLDNFRLATESFSIPSLTGRIRSRFSLSEKAGIITLNGFTINSGNSEAEMAGSLNHETGRTEIQFMMLSKEIDRIIAGSGTKGAGFTDNYKPSGTLSLSGTISGSISAGGSLNLYSQGEYSGGAITIPSKGFRIKNISAPFAFAADLMNIKKIFRLTIDSYTASAESELVTGSLAINRIENPVIDFRINASPDLSILTALTGNKSFKAGGSSRFSLRLYGPLNMKNSDISPLLSLERSANIFLQNATLEIPEEMFSASDITGNIMVTDNIWFDAVSLNYCGSRTILNGKLSRFDDLAGITGTSPSISAAVWTEKLSDPMLIPFTGNRTDRSGTGIFSRSEFNLDIRSDSLTIGKFRASALNTNLSYREKTINIGSFRLNTLDGTVEGHATLIPLSGNRYAGRGWFDINGIDINKTFTLFNNFGQNYITDQNIRGKLTGEITLSGETITRFKPDPSSIIIDGNYLISNGELVEFEPLLKLSRFVEISELERVRFSELSNEITISNRIILIPAMEIQSSAFNISLAGIHSFDGEYTYHLRLLLSELLSRKRDRSNVADPFGSVEDDGLGRTALFLKVEGDRNGSRVSHDMKSLRNEIRTDIEKEKSNLRTILNEEYGWYGSDTITAPAREATKRFRIVWEGTDTTTIKRDSGEEKILPLKNILRRKKKEEDLF
ncbi:MAG: hypothetical protein LC649_07770 [Bacteroidales bacterium]|nr:hypothetical protein [Bacteroidales bacterium]